MTEPLCHQDSGNNREWKRYPQYKESGVEWLGEVPEGWDSKRLKFTVDLVNEKVDATNTDIPYIGLENIESWTGRYIPSEIPVEMEGLSNHFTAGDVLLGKLRPYLAKIFKTKRDGICTSELLVLHPKLVNQKFLFYYTISKDFITTINSSTYGVKMPRANWDVIGNLPSLIPSLPEQTAIAAFLDRETARIDALIEKKERLIALLEEKRAGLINHAVTKGLDPSVPMKDSGVDWIGMVPAGWKLLRLKQISPKISVGLVINPSTYVDPEGCIPILLGSDIKEFSILTHNLRKISKESNSFLNKTQLFSNDLVTVRVGYPGLTAVIPPELNECNCASMMIIRRSPKFNSDWLCYALNSDIGKSQIKIVQYGAAQKQFNISHAVEFRFPVPPLEEQIKISEYLSNCRKQIDDIKKKIIVSIQLLKESRSALISAAVTGKIDLRQEAMG